MAPCRSIPAWSGWMRRTWQQAPFSAKGTLSQGTAVVRGDLRQLATDAGRFIDLTGYQDWSTWLTVNVDAPNVSRLYFVAPDAIGSGFWPSVDNIRIDEPTAVPEPTSLALLAIGGLGVVARCRKRAA